MTFEWRMSSRCLPVGWGTFLSSIPASRHRGHGRLPWPVCIIPPNSFALARSLEYIRMPRNVLGAVLGKSTYARCGIVTNFTPLEPGWHGYITIEISNTTPLPAKIYSNEGIAQVLFFEGDAPCEVSYADKQGEYQGQQGLCCPGCSGE